MRTTRYRLLPVLLLAPLAGCAQVTSAGPPVPAAVTQDTGDNPDGPKAVVDPVDPSHLRRGPARPSLGVAYPFDVLSHCGIDYTRFGNRIWQAQQGQPEPSPLPDTQGNTRYTGYTAGTMTLISPYTAHFVIDIRRAQPRDASPLVILHPTEVQPPACD